MSREQSTQLVDSDGLRESLAEICASHDEFHRFFAGVFTELDVLSAELVRRHQSWSSERERAAKELQRRREALDTEDNSQLKQMLEETESERAALRTTLEAAQTQADRLAQVTDELSRARTELTQARQEIERLRGDLEVVHHQAAQSQPDGKLQDRLRRMEQERAKLDQERLVLETELDTVRNRAAEMAETLAEQRREMADERQQWTRELKRMRRLLEMLSARQVEVGVAKDEGQATNDKRRDIEPSSLAPHPAPPGSAAIIEEDGDPVLDSVMAQFEMLQKDIVRRRQNMRAGNAADKKSRTA